MTWPDATLRSIYNAFPRKTGRAAALPKIGEALDRIVEGEIDGKPRTAEEAVLYLRERVDRFRGDMAGREKKFIAHPATWLNQRRYLRTSKPAEIPQRLDVCIELLAMYPKMPQREHIEQNVENFLPALTAVSRAINGKPASFIQHLAERTALYAFYVSQWPVADLQYVPGPQRWFSEPQRWNADERTWQRNNNGPVAYEQERNQIRRVIGA